MQNILLNALSAKDMYGPICSAKEFRFDGTSVREMIELAQPNIYPPKRIPFRILSPSKLVIGNKQFLYDGHQKALFSPVWDIVVVSADTALKIIKYLLSLKGEDEIDLETTQYSYSLGSSPEWMLLIEEAKKGIGKRDVHYMVRSIYGCD
ncbi:MAG: hypothetical protein JW908_00455 [Anaerolineales bacterium]|nr:hypothetical protein [Anaerolineales bacterium]